MICNLLSFATSQNDHFCMCMLQKAEAARLFPTLEEKSFCSEFRFSYVSSKKMGDQMVTLV